jgi:hypothetical protein
MRLYYDLDIKDPVLSDLCQLVCSNDNLDICDVANLPGTPMTDARDRQLFFANLKSGANPTIASYNASVVNFYNATDYLARFETKKNIFF